MRNPTRLVERNGFHWFVRAHLESTGGQLSSADATSEVDAAIAAHHTAQEER